MKPTSAKAKGRSEEHRIAQLYRDAGYDQAERKRGGWASDDLAGLPFPVEVKKRKRWDIPTWLRKLTAAHESEVWVLHVADGDERKMDSLPRVMVLPEEWGMELMELWREHGQRDSTGDSQPAR